MSFTLSIAGTNLGTFTSLGADGLKMNLRNQESSVFKFCLDGTAMDAVALSLAGSETDSQAVGKVCQVFNGSTCIFSGRLFRIPRVGSGKEEKIEYEIRDPWEQLKSVVYEQIWTLMASRNMENGQIITAPSTIGELILGQDQNGNQLTGSQIIADVIAWAATCGAQVQAGDIVAPWEIPYDNVTDLTCSEVIKRVLRWMPDAVTWFDYTTTPPTFHCAPRASLTPLSLPFVGDIEQQDIQAMPELTPPVVVLNYIQENTSNLGPTGVTVVTDLWPVGQSPDQLNAMVMTCRLAGSKSTYQQQAVVCLQPLPTADNANAEGGPADDPTLQWWQRKLGWLLNLGDSDFSAADIANQLVIEYVSAVYQQGQPGDDGTGQVPVDWGTYPNELLSGNIASWMGVKVTNITVTAGSVSYSYPDSTADYSDQDWAATQIFGPDEGDGFSPPCSLSANATATNAVTKTYTQLTGYVAPEPVPSGLAEQIYSSVSQIQYEGSYTTVSQEIQPVSLGIVMNLTGGRIEWTAMNALVQEIECDLDLGKVSYKFSQHGHLSFQDLMELIRMNRQRVVSARYAERTTGQADSSQPIIGATAGASSGGATPPSAGEPWINSTHIQDTMSGIGLTWEALFGYGESDFVGNDPGQIGRAQPIEKMEIAVGYGGWTGPIHDGSALNNQFSLITGSTYSTDDEVRIWASQEGGGGSATLMPGVPQVYLSQNRTPPEDTSASPFSFLSYQEMKINGGDGSYADIFTTYLKLQEAGGSYIELGDSSLEIYSTSTGTANYGTGSFTLTDTVGNSAALAFGEEGSLLTFSYHGGELVQISGDGIEFDTGGGNTGGYGYDGWTLNGSGQSITCSVGAVMGDVTLQQIDLTSMGGPKFYAFQ